MMTDTKQLEHFFLFEQPLRQELFSYKTGYAKKGEIIVKQHSYVKLLPLLLEGSLRVYKQTEDREILCYYIQKGGTCALSLGACLEDKKVQCEVVASQTCEMFLIPSLTVKEWQRKYSTWNQYIISTFTQRQQQLLDIFGEVAFSKMEKRINDYLCELMHEQHSFILSITHQELANELGTTRVVVSRILKHMELSGAIQLLRGSIKVKKLHCPVA